MTKKKKNESGRPSLMTPEIVKKLEDAFAKGFNVSDACILANVSRETFYNYCERTAGFLDKCKALQQRPLLKSVLVINDAIENGDVNTAKWYAERKRKDEFSLKTETEHSGEVKSKVVYIEKEEKDSYEKQIDDVINGD